LLQRGLQIGYARAARLIDKLEAAGVLGPVEGSNPRKLLIRSSEEIFSKRKKLPKNEPEETRETFKNYEVPKELKLSQVGKSWWGKSFADIINSTEVQDSIAVFKVRSVAEAKATTTILRQTLRDRFIAIVRETS
jgi:hypothetical protein